MTGKNSRSQISDTLIFPGELNFHPVLKDIENMFWFFILSHKALARPDVQNIIKMKEDSSIISMLEKYNEWVNLKTIINSGNKFTSNLNLLDSMIFLGKATAILTYDFLLFSKYNAIINRDEEFQFLRHIRNGAAHYNKFNLKDEKGEWKIGEDEVIRWDRLKISRSLQGKRVFNDFIALPGMFLLAKYFSEKLTEIDKEQK